MILDATETFTITIYHSLPWNPITLGAANRSWTERFLADLRDPGHLFEFPAANDMSTLHIPARSVIGVHITPEVTR